MADTRAFLQAEAAPGSRRSRPDTPDTGFDRAYRGAQAIGMARADTADELQGPGRDSRPSDFAALVARVAPADHEALTRLAHVVPIEPDTLVALRDGDLAPDELAPEVLVLLARALGLTWPQLQSLMLPFLDLESADAWAAEVRAVWRAAEAAEA